MRIRGCMPIPVKPAARLENRSCISVWELRVLTVPFNGVVVGVQRISILELCPR